MSTSDDRIYYRGRAEHARACAARAASSVARGIHLELASRYAMLGQEAAGEAERAPMFMPMPMRRTG